LPTPWGKPLGARGNQIIESFTPNGLKKESQRPYGRKEFNRLKEEAFVKGPNNGACAPNLPLKIGTLGCSFKRMEIIPWVNP